MGKIVLTPEVIRVDLDFILDGRVICPDFDDDTLNDLTLGAFSYQAVYKQAIHRQGLRIVNNRVGRSSLGKRHSQEERKLSPYQVVSPLEFENDPLDDGDLSLLFDIPSSYSHRRILLSREQGRYIIFQGLEEHHITPFARQLAEQYVNWGISGTYCYKVGKEALCLFKEELKKHPYFLDLDSCEYFGPESNNL